MTPDTMMDAQDRSELIAWRLAFNHIADGTPDNVASAINAEMDSLKREAHDWRKVAQAGQHLAEHQQRV